MKPDEANLAANKNIYESLASDLSLLEAIEELIDNAIDNWTLRTERNEDLQINIECDGNSTVARDNSGGIEPEELESVFGVGKTLSDSAQWSIGAYGLGSKKAIARIGELNSGRFSHFTVKSRLNRNEEAHGFTVNGEWFEKEDVWKVDINQFDGVDPGSTEITIEAEEPVWFEDNIRNLKRKLARTYSKFLSGEAREQEGEVSILVNGDTVTYEEEVDWSFIPIDNLYPRCYYNITIDKPHLDGTINMQVTVGLMQRKNSNIAGTDIFFQDRMVVFANTDEQGGYGRGDTEIQIGKNFTTHNERLKIIVELRTEGDASDLPWNNQKNRIDLGSSVTEDIHAELRDLVRPYFTATSNNIPKAIATQYSGDSHHAANDGEIKPVKVTDYGSTDAPTDYLHRIKKLKKISTYHAWQGIVINCDSSAISDCQILSKEELPAYQELVKDAVAEEEELEEDELDQVKPNRGEDVFEKMEEVHDELNEIDRIGEKTIEKIFKAGYGSMDDLEDINKTDLEEANVRERKAEKIIQTIMSGDEGEVDDNEKENQDVTTEYMNTKMKIEGRAMEKVMQFEENKGRYPDDVSDDDRGYDIKSSDHSGNTRYIEVKGKKSTGEIILTENEWEKAEEEGDSYWLYIVPNALEQSSDFVQIQNPESKLDSNKNEKTKIEYRISQSDWSRYQQSRA